MFTCIICLDLLKKEHDIWSTECGHVFHNNCLRDWMRGNNSCPQCRQANVSSHKIFMTFLEDSPQSSNASLALNIDSDSDIDPRIVILSLEQRVKDLETQLSNVSATTCSESEAPQSTAVSSILPHQLASISSPNRSNEDESNGDSSEMTINSSPETYEEDEFVGEEGAEEGNAIDIMDSEEEVPSDDDYEDAEIEERQEECEDAETEEGFCTPEEDDDCNEDSNSDAEAHVYAYMEDSINRSEFDDDSLVSYNEEEENN